MKQLEESFVKNDMQYNLVKRTDKVAMYSLSSRYYNKPIVAYEVFDIPMQKASSTTLGGKQVNYEEGERIPSNEEFGKKFRSGAYNSISIANEMFDKLNANPPVRKGVSLAKV